VNNVQISNSFAHEITHAGWQTGGSNDLFVDGIGFVNVSVTNVGCKSTYAPNCTSTGSDDGFFFVGGRNVWCVNCTAYSVGQRGVNTGVIHDNTMGGDFVYHFRNLISYDNGYNASPQAGAYGIGTSGNDWK